MGEGDHRRDPDPAPHQQGPRRAWLKLEMVDGLGDEDLAPGRENPVHELRSAPARIFAQHADLVDRAVAGIAGHGILAQEFWGHDDVEMGPRRPLGQVAAVEGAEFILGDIRCHLLGPCHLDPDHRRIPGHGVAVQVVRFAPLKPQLVLAGRDHGLVGFDPLFAVHRERVGPGVRGQGCGIDRERLILVFQVEVPLQIAPIERVLRGPVGPVRLQLQIPPPFLDVIEAAIAHRVIEPGQKRRGLRNGHRCPSEGLFGKEAFKVPWAGLHAAPAHGAALGGDPVGRAFLAVGFPDLVAVEHQFRASRDRPRGAFAGAFVAALAEGLKPEVDGLVMGQRHVGGDHSRLETRAEIGVQDHLADAADLAQARQQQERRLQYLAIQHRMRLGAIAEVPDLLRDHPAQEGKPQIGAHGLGHGDPVVAAGALHGLVALVDDHADRLVVGRIDGVAHGIVRIPGPVRAARDPHRVDAKEIARRLDVRGIAGGIRGARPVRVRHTVLDQHEGPKRPTLRIRRRGLAGIVAALGALLQRLAHIPELGAGEHVGPLGHAGHVCLVDIGGGAVDPLELLERMRAVDEATLVIGVAIERRALDALAYRPAQPARTGARGERPVAGQVHPAGDRRHAKARADEGGHELPRLDPGQPGRHAQPVEVHVRCRA